MKPLQVKPVHAFVTVLALIGLVAPAMADQGGRGSKQRGGQQTGGASQDRGGSNWDWLYIYDPFGPDVLIEREALTGGQQQQQQQQQARQQQQRQQGQQQQGQTRISGTVQGTRTVNINNRQHTLAQVQTDSGDRVFVHLGSGDQAVDVSQGQQIQAMGRMGQINNRSILFAQRVSTDGQTFNIQRGPGQRQQAMQQQMQQDRQPVYMGQQPGQNPRQVVTVRGTIQDTRSMNFSGQQDKHVLAKIKTQEGKTLIADLGPRQSVQKIQNLQKGQQVTLSGTAGRVNDKPVLVAQQLRIGGQNYTLQSQGGQQQQQQNQRQQMQQSEQQDQQTQGQSQSPARNQPQGRVQDR